MSRTSLFRGFLLAGIVTLTTMPVFAQMPEPSANSYMAPDSAMPQPYRSANGQPQASQSGSLGTLQQSDLAGTSANTQPPPSSMQTTDSYTAMQPMQNGEIRYITGGIGDEERAALKQMADQYDVHIMSASASGAFVGDTQIRITSAKGNELLSAAAGPLFYADLPSGRYTIEASSNGQSKRQTLMVAHGKPAHLNFIW